MATLSSPGIGSNLDVNTIVSQLMAVERASLTKFADREKSFQAKISAFGRIKSALSSFQTAAQALKTATALNPRKATSDDSATVGATASSSATAGTYAIKVTQLAQSQKIATATGNNFSATTSFEKGSLVIETGTFGGSFSTTATINLSDKNYTLAEIRDKINSADAGISATLVNTGSETRLVLTGSDTGADKAFRISATAPDGSAESLSKLEYDIGSPAYSVASEAKNSIIEIDTIEITRSTNTITDAIDGVTLTLGKESEVGKTTAVTVAVDTEAQTKNIEAFVKGYNDVVKLLKELSAYNEGTKTAATLNGDSTVRSIEGQLRGIFNSAVSGAPSGSQRLSDIGVTFQKDGTLAIDSSKLKTALTDTTKDLSKLFADDGTVKGYAAQIDTLMTNLLDVQGLIASRTEGLNSSIKGIGKNREALELRLELMEKRYRAQFSALDTLIGQMSSTSQYLQQQLARLQTS